MFSYDETQLASTTAGSYSGASIGQRNQVRLMIQDTDSNRPLFQDEEVDWTITTSANVYTAAANLCDLLVAKTRGTRYKKISGLAMSVDVQFYINLSANLRARGAGHQVPYAGGISKTDKLAQQQDADWEQPKVGRGLGDNPAAPQPEVKSNNPLTTI